MKPKDEGADANTIRNINAAPGAPTYVVPPHGEAEDFLPAHHHDARLASATTIALTVPRASREYAPSCDELFHRLGAQAGAVTIALQRDGKTVSTT